MKIENELGLKIFEAYKRSIFGKVSKLEIDLIVFAMLVKEIFSNDCRINQNNNFNWLRLDSRHIRQLSFELQITENRVSNLLEQASLLELKKEQSESLIFDEILFLIKNTRQDIGDINQGKLKFYIPNKITKSAVMAFLAKNNSVPDLSFNQAILTVRLIDLIAAHTGKDIMTLLYQMSEDAKYSEKSEELKNIIKIANSKSGSEKIMLAAKSALKYFLGTGGEYLSESFFDFIKTRINS
jgi:hypothetical protein